MRQDKETKEPKDPEQDRRLALQSVIKEQLVQRLGRPRELRSVQVRFICENRYRANVLVGPDVVSTRIAHSYFLMTDAAGQIIDSSPKITRQYGAVQRLAEAEAPVLALSP